MGGCDPLWPAPFGVGGVGELGFDVAVYFADFEAYIGPILEVLAGFLAVRIETRTNGRSRGGRKRSHLAAWEESVRPQMLLVGTRSFMKDEAVMIPFVCQRKGVLQLK